jgi:tagatose 6-phosphate kinase
MILVVCPNLALDVTLEVDALEVGAVHRARSSRKQAGGKGVNVARALRALGEETLVLGFAGGRAGDDIARGLGREGIAYDLIPFEGESRTCTIVLERGGVATVVNEEGPEIEDASELQSRFERRIDGARAAAFMGSLPPRMPSSTYAALVASSRRAGASSLVDTSGAALREAVAARPTAAKPNRSEAEALLGEKLDTPESRVRALEEIRRLGAGVAIVTFGAEGFLVSDGDTLGRCTVPASSSSDLRLGNPTGAGDALAAGFLAGTARGYPLEDRARLAAACAVASLGEGYGRIRAKDVRVESVRFERLLPSAG